MRRFLITILFSILCSQAAFASSNEAEPANECALSYEEMVFVLERNAPFVEQMNGVIAVFFGMFNDVDGCSFSVEFLNHESYENVTKVFSNGLVMDGYPVTFVEP